MSRKKPSQRQAAKHRQVSPQAARLILVVLALSVLLAGLALRGSDLFQSTQPTTPTPDAQSTAAEPTNIPLESLIGSQEADRTTGIILGGAMLVLIVVGGTLGATRRDPPPPAG